MYRIVKKTLTRRYLYRGKEVQFVQFRVQSKLFSIFGLDIWRYQGYRREWDNKWCILEFPTLEAAEDWLQYKLKREYVDSKKSEVVKVTQVS